MMEKIIQENEPIPVGKDIHKLIAKFATHSEYNELIHKYMQKNAPKIKEMYIPSKYIRVNSICNDNSVPLIFTNIAFVGEQLDIFTINWEGFALPVIAGKEVKFDGIIKFSYKCITGKKYNVEIF